MAKARARACVCAGDGFLCVYFPTCRLPLWGFGSRLFWWRASSVRNVVFSGVGSPCGGGKWDFCVFEVFNFYGKRVFFLIFCKDDR